MANYLKPPPRDLPYPALKDAMHRSTLIQKSDPLYATDMSSDVATKSTAVFTMPAGTLVLKAWANVTTGMSAASKVKISLGDSDVAYRLYGNGAAAVTIASTGAGFYNPVALVTDSVTTYQVPISTSTPKFYDTETTLYGTLALVTDSDVVTSGVVEFYVEYLPYADHLPWLP